MPPESASRWWSTLPAADFASELPTERVALMAWALPSDLRWVRPGDTGISQVSEPKPGELPAFFRQRLASMKSQVLVWSHGWVHKTEGRWQDGTGYLQRRISIDQARKIAATGVVVGLWGLALSRPGPSRDFGNGKWTVSRGYTRGYARELSNLNWLGADHVGIGTDIEGVGAGWSVNRCGHVRSVIDALQDMKVPSAVIEKVAFANYARVLGAALPA